MDFDRLLDRLRAGFFRNFLHFLLFASSVAMWAVPVWVGHNLGTFRLSFGSQVAGVLAVYGLNWVVLRRPGLSPRRWLRRYSALAFGLLLCFAFLIFTTVVFSAGRAVLAVVDPDLALLATTAEQAVGLAGVATILGLLVFGYTGGQRQLQINHVPISMPGLGGALRVVQLSDIHVGQNLGFEQLVDFVERVNALDPDLVILTGDIADGPKSDLERFFPVLGGIRARHGTLAILGNHDHNAGADRVEAALVEVGIDVLRDRATTLDLDGCVLHVMGLDDRGPDWARGYREDLTLGRLLAEAPPEVPRLLLVHRPDVFRQAAELKVNLTLSGHTHGGQLALPWFGGRRRNLAEFVTKFDRGLFRAGESSLYVNCGLGVTAQRIRLFTPREITVLDLAAVSVGGEIEVEPRLRRVIQSHGAMWRRSGAGRVA